MDRSILSSHPPALGYLGRTQIEILGGGSSGSSGTSGIGDGQKPGECWTKFRHSVGETLAFDYPPWVSTP